jgi:hypothetical protein
MTILSAVLGRKVYFNRGYYTLYPNFFTVLVAGSARCRKSTAIGIGMGLLRELECSRIIEGKTSMEKFISDLQWPGPRDEPAPPIMIAEDELSVFLTRDSQGDKMIDLLTKLFDCPKQFSYKTWAHQTITLRDVYMTILAGTTPEGMAKSMPDTAFGGGFASRILFIFQQDTARRNALPELTPEEVRLKETLIQRLQSISELQGEYHLTPEGREFFIDWYNNMDFPEDKRMEGYYGRKHDHVLRASIVIAAAQETTLEIGPNHIDAAIAALQAIETFMPRALAQIGTTDVRVHIERVSRQMQKYKRITHSELLKKNYHYLDGKQFKEVVGVLMETGHIVRDPTKPHFYIWKEPMPGQTEEETPNE